MKNISIGLSLILGGLAIIIENNILETFAFLISFFWAYVAGRIEEIEINNREWKEHQEHINNIILEEKEKRNNNRPKISDNLKQENR